jgi:hypothetical protein
MSGTCRVVANQRGYADDPSEEGFDLYKIVRVVRASMFTMSGGLRNVITALPRLQSSGDRGAFARNGRI